MHSFSLLATAVALSSSTAAAAFDLTTSFATKSSYWDQSKDLLGAGAFAKQATPEQEAEYTLVQIQNVVRHGTRFPTKGNTIEIENLLKKLQTSYGDVVPAWLKTYKLPYNVSVEGELAAAGTKETQAFGARSRTRVGDAVPRKYSSDKYLVEHTFKPRTKDTAKAFIAGFFSNPEDVVLVEHPKKSDLLFRFFDECPRYESQIADNATAQTELTAFKATPTFQKTIGSLRTALNLPADANITAKDVESAFSACAFDLALYGIRDAWCTLLSEDFIETNDYAEDLETFMEHGGGAKISYEISAVLLRDIYQDFTKFAGQQNGSLVGHLRFVHAETVLPLMTLLGYADKTPLSGTATASQIANRKFRSSRLSPFMANIEFRLYTKRSRSGTTKCRSLEEDDEGGEVKYYAQIRLNEQVTAVPGCDGKVFCSLSKLKKIWGYYLNDYNFAAECKVLDRMATHTRLE